MKILDMFAGLKGWSTAFKERGHEVITTDFDPKFNCDITKNILDLKPDDLPWVPDIILASPPCEAFSVMQIGRNWTGPNDENPNQPKTDRARMALKVLEKTVSFIQEIKPRFFVIENPRGKMRKMTVMQSFECRTVTYCQYGMKWQKPTDLWGGFPPSLILKPVCKPGAPCHEAAPRGSSTGVQSRISPEERAIIPKELALAVCIAAEKDINSFPIRHSLFDL